jgi:ribosomal protein L23
MDQTQHGRYTFRVAEDANKLQIKRPSRISSRSTC